MRLSSGSRPQPTRNIRRVLLLFAFSVSCSLWINGYTYSSHFLRLAGVSSVLDGFEPPAVSPSAVLPDQVHFPWEDKEEISSGLPRWITDYVDWHTQMRKDFPGRLLFTHPQAPKLLIRTCVNKCGGLHDRLGKLPWDLYLANQTRRVLLIHWCTPAPLTTFFAPNKLDWRIPALENGSDPFYSSKAACVNEINPYPSFFEHTEYRPGLDFWKTQFGSYLNLGKNSTEKVLRFQLLGNELDLQRILLQQHNESDDLNTTPSFGKIFWMLFRPTTFLEMSLKQEMERMGLKIGQYSAAHCRVRHPKSVTKQAKLAPYQSGGPDKHGLIWDNAHSKAYAVGIATNALRCAQTTSSFVNQSTMNGRLKVYFYADSEALVHFIVGQENSTARAEVDWKAPLETTQIQQALDIVGRVQGQNLHLDRQLDRPPHEYMGTFLDFLLGSMAKCVALGVGNFARFAAKVGYTPCGREYQAERWGQEPGRLTQYPAC